MQSLRNNLPFQENVFGWNSDDARTYACNMMNSCPGKPEDMKKTKKKITNNIFFIFFFPFDTYILYECFHTHCVSFSCHLLLYLVQTGIYGALAYSRTAKISVIQVKFFFCSTPTIFPQIFVAFCTLSYCNGL